MKGDPIRRAARSSWLLIVLAGSAGCGSDALRGLFVGYTPHEQYEHSLRAAGLDQTALGREWLAAAVRAIEEPVPIEAPYREVSYLDARAAGAVGYRVTMRRGERMTVDFDVDGDTTLRVFLDMFVLPNNAAGEPVLLASADSLSHELEYVARREGEYLLRIQPELLRGGRYTVTIEVGGSLGFPVAEYDTRAIRSWWGDWRAGGRRHEGVDIFAPRGTPVLAAAAGTVRSTRPNNLGGNVVWLRDELGRSHYYAHLDSQLVRQGDRVRLGDTIGFVGNTGNARTTPPHLHFGVFERGYGAFDPLPAIEQPTSRPALFAGDPEMIGSMARVSRNRTAVRAGPMARSPLVAELTLHTLLSVEAGSGEWYRVLLPDGTKGYVPAGFTEPVDRPIRSELLADGALIRSQPVPTGAPLDSLVAGQQVPVLGTYGGHLFVQSPSGRAGWLVLD